MSRRELVNENFYNTTIADRLKMVSDIFHPTVVVNRFTRTSFLKPSWKRDHDEYLKSLWIILHKLYAFGSGMPRSILYNVWNTDSELKVYIQMFFNAAYFFFARFAAGKSLHSLSYCKLMYVLGTHWEKDVRCVPNRKIIFPVSLCHSFITVIKGKFERFN